MEHVANLAHDGIGQFRGLQDGGMLASQQILAAALGPYLSTVHDGHPVAEIFDIGEEMGAERHRLAAGGQRGDQVLDLPGTDRVHAAGRLIQYQQLGVVDQGLRSADAALHALRILADRAILHCLQADHFQQHVDPLPPATPASRLKSRRSTRASRGR